MDLSQLKFRHLYGELYKAKYENIQSSAVSTESCGIKGNPLYCAFPWKTSGGGALAILPNDNPHKLAVQPPLISGKLQALFLKIVLGHQGSVLDFEFYPFNDSYIATASEDSEIRLWEIPEEMKEDLITPISTLSGHGKKVTLINFNKSTSSLLASTSYDKTIKIWNLDKPSQQLSIQEPDYTLALQWNYMGDQLGYMCKDKHFKILDPRSGAHIANIQAHDGPKTQTCFNKLQLEFTWLGNSDYCLTCGFSKKFERQFKLWDLRHTEKPIQTQNIDSSAGTLYPFYDNDTQILFLAGKGDGNIRFYEFFEGQFFACSNTFQTNKPGMAYGFLNKQSVNVMQHEIMRGLKLTDYVNLHYFSQFMIDQTVEFIKFCAPRKSEAFQEDLFPETISNIAAQNAEDWFSGETKPPLIMSLNPSSNQMNERQKQQKVKLQEPKSAAEISFFLDSSMQVASIQNLAQIKQLEDDYHQMKFENKQLKEKIAGQKGQIEQLEIAVAAEQDKSPQIKPGEAELEDNLKKIEILKQEINEIQEQIQQVEAQFTRNQVAVDKQKNESQEAEQQREQLTEKLKILSYIMFLQY